MAQRIVTLLEDDLDGSEASETVTFALDGTSYEIDLNDKNAGKLRDALTKYIAAGRKVGRSAPRGRKPAAGGTTPAEIRAWATSNGYDVPARGRIPADVRAAFEAAN
jgi:hypothetical protein